MGLEDMFVRDQSVDLVLQRDPKRTLVMHNYLCDLLNHAVSDLKKTQYDGFKITPRAVSVVI